MVKGLSFGLGLIALCVILLGAAMQGSEDPNGSTFMMVGVVMLFAALALAAPECIKQLRHIKNSSIRKEGS